MIANPEKPWLDVHILHAMSTREEWWEKCYESVVIAQAQAGFPIGLHILPAEPNHLGRGRHRGFTAGEAPYVTQIDDDDYVHPHAFSQLKLPMATHADAIFPQELLEQIEERDGVTTVHPLSLGRQRHSMKVFRREHLIDHSRWHWASDLAQLAYLEKTPGLKLLDLPEPSYVWRVYTRSHSYPLRLQYPHELTLARQGPPFTFPDA